VGVDDDLRTLVQAQAVGVHRMVMNNAETRRFGGQPFAVSFTVPPAAGQPCGSNANGSSNLQPKFLKFGDVCSGKYIGH